MKSQKKLIVIGIIVLLLYFVLLKQTENCPQVGVN